MDYNVPARAYIKKIIKEGFNPLLPNYVGRIGRKLVYEADRPLDSMDDILVRTKKGVREVTTEEWGKLKGYPRLGVPLLNIGGGSYKTPSYIFGLSWETHLLPL
jgi:hypothetical protein